MVIGGSIGGAGGVGHTEKVGVQNSDAPTPHLSGQHFTILPAVPSASEM